MNNSNSQHTVKFRKVKENGKLVHRPINYGTNANLYNYGEHAVVPVLRGYKYSHYYLWHIYHQFEKAFLAHSRVLHLRVDLRFPHQPHDMPIRIDSDVITRFFSSFRAKIKADIARRRKQGHRVHDTKVIYAWACEYGQVSQQEHYHVVILLNADTYRGMFYDFENDKGLYRMIDQAWLSAIALSGKADKASQLVHVPTDGSTVIHKGNAKARENALRRASYLAKKNTKPKGHGRRRFGCSR